MNVFKKALSYILILAVLVSVFPGVAFADEDEYKISNEYLSFTFNQNGRFRDRNRRGKSSESA